MATFSTASFNRRGNTMTDTYADQDYFLDDKGNPTTDTQAAATLLIRKGQEISKEVADVIGKGNSAKTVSEDDGEKASGPASNKAELPKSNKGA